jgi:hypothetical protein
MVPFCTQSCHLWKYVKIKRVWYQHKIHSHIPSLIIDSCLLFIGNRSISYCIYSYQRWGQSLCTASSVCVFYVANPSSRFRENVQNGTAISNHRCTYRPSRYTDQTTGLPKTSACVMHSCNTSRSSKNFILIKVHINQEGFLRATRPTLISASYLGKVSVVDWGTMLQSRKVAGSIPDEVTGYFKWSNPSSRTMVLGSTQPLTEMSTRNLPGG